MTNSELNDKISEIYRDNWIRLPGIFRFERKKTIVWFCLILAFVILSVVLWYIYRSNGGIGSIEVTGNGEDQKLTYVNSADIGGNIILLAASAAFMITAIVLVLILLKARSLEKKLFSEASIHATHLSEKKREQEFVEQIELRKLEDKEIEEHKRSMKAEFCPKCGLLMIPGNNTCPSCGTVVEEKEA